MTFPELEDPNLAYETGLHIGDGNLTRYPPQYRYVLSGNRTTEYEFYRGTVIPLIRRVYDLTSSLYTENNSVYAIVYSKPLVIFKSEVIGLPIGPKDQLLRLPNSITGKGRASNAHLLSGMFDADGSPKIRRTSSGNYPRISFAQKVRGIVEDVHRILSDEFSISSTMYRNDYFDKRRSVVDTRWFLDINGSENLARYGTHIGSRNPKVNRRLRQLGQLD